MIIQDDPGFDKERDEALLTEYLPKIAERVKISKVKHKPLYNIYGESYELYRTVEDEKHISFVFRHAYSSESPLQQIKCRKISHFVKYNSFTQEKFTLTPEEKKLREKEYQKMYYQTRTIEKREKKRQRKKIVCPICGKEFHPVNRQLTCSPECRKEYIKRRNNEYKENNKEHLKEKAKEWAKNNPEKLKLIAKKYRASEKGKATVKRYLQSEKGQIAAKKAYENTRRKVLEAKKDL